MINLLRYGSFILESEETGKYFIGDTDIDLFYDIKFADEVGSILDQTSSKLGNENDVHYHNYRSGGSLIKHIEAYPFQVKGDSIKLDSSYGNIALMRSDIFPLRAAYFHGLEIPIPSDPLVFLLKLPIPSDDDSRDSEEFWTDMKFGEYGNNCEEIVLHSGISKILNVGEEDLKNMFYKCGKILSYQGFASWLDFCSHIF